MEDLFASLTDKEVYVIEAIVSNEFSGYNYHLPDRTTEYDEIQECNGDCCWANTIEYNGAKNGTPVAGKALSGVVGSLKKKGCIVTGNEVVSVTRKGWESYREAMKIRGK